MPAVACARAKDTSSARTAGSSRRTPSTRWCATSCRAPRRWATTRRPRCDMSIALNHTIVWCRDQRVSAEFLADLFGLPAPVHWGPFMIVDMANGVSLDYHEVDREIASQHYAFLVTE